MVKYRIEWSYINNSISNNTIHNGKWFVSKEILESHIDYLNINIALFLVLFWMNE